LLAHVFYNTALVMRIVGDAWAQMDPDLVHAARTLGATRMEAARRVTLPILAPAVGAAALLVFLFTFTSFGVILILGGPRYATLEVEIYHQTVALFDLPLAAALSIVQLACTLAVTVAYTSLSRRLSQTRRLRSSAGAERAPVGAARVAWVAYAVALTAFLVAPLAALTLRSVTPVSSTGPALTADYYRALTENPRGSAFHTPPTAAIATSLGYATTTAALAIALGLPAAWALMRRPHSKGGRVLEPLLLLPLGTSAVTLGLGFVIALDSPPLDLRASPALVPLAHTLVAFPFVVRVLVPSLAAIQPRLREAAAVLGAHPRDVARRVDLPLAARGLAVAGIFAFVISMGEFGATAMVARPEHPTMPIAIHRFLSRPGALNFGQGMAMATILMFVTAVGIAAVERLRVAVVGEF
jgi:thiamine transport system permease protein